MPKIDQAIEQLLPHRDPFLFVDEILRADREEIVAIKNFQSKDSWLRGSFPEFNFVPGMILVESMAQCGGAAIRMSGIVEGIFALTTIERADFFKGAEFDKTVTYLIKNIRVSEKLIKQSGAAFVEGAPVLEAEWMSVKIQ